MIKKIFKFLFIISLFIIPLKVAAHDNYVNIESYEYVITNYNIDIVVNEDNTLDITETIGAYFSAPKHGIYREIPLKNTVTRLDGTVSKNIARITNIDVNNRYTTYYKGSNKIIKIGDPKVIMKGHQDYIIKYKYGLGKDLSKEYDELYFNLIGDSWDTIINSITFQITMPKDFDAEKLGFSSGRFCSIASSGINYKVENNVITGRYNGYLNPHEALTVRLELDDGYFIVSNEIYVMLILAIIIPIIFILIAFYLRLKYGKNKTVVETIEFYPPEGLNSAEIGLLYKGMASNNDVVSLLIYLANTGYLKIFETETRGLFRNNNDFKILKLKDYDGDSELEDMFLRAFFKNKVIIKKTNEIEFPDTSNISNKKGNDNNILDEITATEFKERIGLISNILLENLNSEENQYTIFEKGYKGRQFLIMLMVLVTFILVTIIPAIDFGEPLLLIFAATFSAFCCVAMFPTTCTKNPLIGKIISILIFASILVRSSNPILASLLISSSVYIYMYIYGVICSMLLFVFYKYMPRRTVYGNEMLGKIRGFKNFLKVVEKPKLEELVLQNSTYFYDILPYTYVLGVSNKWIKKFESITVEKPDWFEGISTFDINSFGSFMSSTMSSASTSASSSGGSADGGSSGGGSSGGGSGGGGGGSW